MEGRKDRRKNVRRKMRKAKMGEEKDKVKLIRKKLIKNEN